MRSVFLLVHEILQLTMLITLRCTASLFESRHPSLDVVLFSHLEAVNENRTRLTWCNISVKKMASEIADSSQQIHHHHHHPWPCT